MSCHEQSSPGFHLFPDGIYRYATVPSERVYPEWQKAPDGRLEAHAEFQPDTMDGKFLSQVPVVIQPHVRVLGRDQLEPPGHIRPRLVERGDDGKGRHAGGAVHKGRRG